MLGSSKLIKFQLFELALERKIWFLKKKEKKMKNNFSLNECRCQHCQQKLRQINSSRLYWDNVILRKKLI